MTTLALVVATNQPEIKTWMVRANLIRRIPQLFKAVCFFSPPVCLFGLSSHIPCWQLVWQSSGQTSYAIPRSEEADDRETGRTHWPAPFTQPFCPSPVLTPLLHHLFLPHPLLVHYLCSPRARKYFIPPTPPQCSYRRYYKKTKPRVTSESLVPYVRHCLD